MVGADAVGTASAAAQKVTTAATEATAASATPRAAAAAVVVTATEITTEGRNCRSVISMDCSGSGFWGSTVGARAAAHPPVAHPPVHFLLHIHNTLTVSSCE